MSILITGATGQVGGHIVDELLAARVPVRASSRNPATARVAPGVELVAGDLNEPETMGAALRGVKSVFLYAQNKKLPELMAAMRSAGVEQVVVLSTIDATSEQAYSRYNRDLHRGVEDAVAGAGFRCTMLRPGAFASNTRRFWAADIKAAGCVYLPYPETQQAPVDERDIAAVAVRALLSRSLDGTTPVLTGPKSLTQRQMVATISAALGRPIPVITVPLEEARKLLATRTGAAYVEILLARWADEVGIPPVVTDEVARATGRPARPYAEWVAHNLAAFDTLPRNTA